MDPLAEKYISLTPFNYCQNNPIVLIDPDGMASTYNWDYVDPKTGQNGRYEDEKGNEVSWNQVQDEYGISSDQEGNGGGKDDPPTRETDSKSDKNTVEPSVLGLNQYDVPVWGPVRNAGNCFDKGEYVSSLVWNIIAFGELWSFGLSSEVRFGEAAIKPIFSTAAKTGPKIIEEVAVHGNSLKSLKPTWGYKLFLKDGTFLKNGITSNLIPETRYTKAFMSDKYMEVIPFPNRKAAYYAELLQNQILRGPLNLNMH